MEQVRAAVQRAGDFEMFMHTFETFGIDAARELVRRAQLQSPRDGKVFFIHAPSITPEAQNALLKLFEEPPARTHFFLAVASVDALLGTLRSRVEVLAPAGTAGTAAAGAVDIPAFLHSTLAERLKAVEAFVKAKDTAGALRFLNELEQHLAARGVPEKREALAHIFAVREALQSKGASLKILLESVALTV